LTPVSPDCILKYGCYLCLRDETVSPGFPTRTRLLIWSHSSREECLFHLSATDFPRRVYRVPSAGFHLAVLRTNLGPGANLALLRAHCAQATQIPVSFGETEPPERLPPVQDSRLCPADSGRLDRGQILLLSIFLTEVIPPDNTCVLTDTRTASSLVSVVGELKLSHLLWSASYP